MAGRKMSRGDDVETVKLARRVMAVSCTSTRSTHLPGLDDACDCFGSEDELLG